jgi:hypothetical protein
MPVKNSIATHTDKTSLRGRLRRSNVVAVRKESMSEEMLSRVYGTGKLLFVKITARRV